MECTADNLQALFDFVQADFEDGTLHGRPYGSDRPPVLAKAPRQYPDGSREYFMPPVALTPSAVPTSKSLDDIPSARMRAKTLRPWAWILR
jgi:hypothetical protein